jgi:hypothetical protein
VLAVVRVAPVQTGAQLYSIFTGDLCLTEDLTDIHTHELAGMVGDPKKLQARLVRFFETGVNWDDSKSFLFPGIELPHSKIASVALRDKPTLINSSTS